MLWIGSIEYHAMLLIWKLTDTIYIGSWKIECDKDENEKSYAWAVLLHTFLRIQKKHSDEATAAVAIDVIHITCLLRTSMNFVWSKKEQFVFSRVCESQAIFDWATNIKSNRRNKNRVKKIQYFL